MPRRWKVFTILGFLTIVADQVSKYWARNYLPTDERGYGKAVAIIENFFDWRLSYNTGSAFGLFSSVDGARIFLTVVGLLAIGAIFWMLHKAQDNQIRLHWALGFVAGGAIGNIIDRILFGKVTDFVVWKYYQHEWPTFNVADAALCVGVGLLFLDINRETRADTAARPVQGASEPVDVKPTSRGRKP